MSVSMMSSCLFGITPMSFIINGDYALSESVLKDWDSVNVGLEIKDDLGNSYTDQWRNGYQEDDGKNNTLYHQDFGKLFQKINPKAKKLIVTPSIQFFKYPPGPGDASGGKEPEKVEKKNLDAIVIDVNR